jgi:hypothetical protein
LVIAIPLPFRPIKNRKSLTGNRIRKPPFGKSPGIIANRTSHSSQSFGNLQFLDILKEFRIGIRDTMFSVLIERTNNIPGHGHSQNEAPRPEAEVSGRPPEGAVYVG